MAQKSATPIYRAWRARIGQDFHRTIRLKEADGVTVRDTTDYDCQMVIRSSPNGQVYATLGIGTGIVNTPTSGQFAITITAAALATYTFAAAEYAVYLTDETGQKVVPFVGELVVDP